MTYTRHKYPNTSLFNPSVYSKKSRLFLATLFKVLSLRKDNLEVTPSNNLHYLGSQSQLGLQGELVLSSSLLYIRVSADYRARKFLLLCSFSFAEYEVNSINYAPI